MFKHPNLEPVVVTKPEDIVPLGVEMRKAADAHPLYEKSDGYSKNEEEALDKAAHDQKYQDHGMWMISEGLTRVIGAMVNVGGGKKGQVIISVTLALEKFRVPPRYHVSFGQVLPGGNLGKVPDWMAHPIAEGILGAGWEEVEQEGPLTGLRHFSKKIEQAPIV